MREFSLRGVLICAISVLLLALYLTVWLSFADSSSVKRSDFIIYYAAGSLPLNRLYDLDAQRELEARVVGSPFPIKGEVLPFNHTPIFVPLLHLLVNDNYAGSYLRWTSLLWITALLCGLLIFKMTDDVAFAFAAVSFYPLFTYIQQGHDTIFLLLGILLGAYLLSLRQDLLAGVALSLTTLKPHFAIFFAIPLLVRPRAFLGFSVASTLLALYSVLLVGTRGIFEFLALLRISAGGEGLGVRPLIMFNLLGVMERAGVRPDLARPVAWIVFLFTAIAVFVLWKRNPLNPPFALTMLLAVFTAPHLHGHDLALLLVSFATFSKPNALFLLVSSIGFVALSITSSTWQFALVYLLMCALLAMSIKDARHVQPST
ncbi:MAG TPA: glycosyltransferase 87 family protein [Pyrinomonadaceae bacterium]|nr:glycosyltransferase 87 family protein [Pyrinomonadaceae bacterium]